MKKIPGVHTTRVPNWIKWRDVRPDLYWEYLSSYFAKLTAPSPIFLIKNNAFTSYNNILWHWLVVAAIVWYDNMWHMGQMRLVHDSASGGVDRRESRVLHCFVQTCLFSAYFTTSYKHICSSDILVPLHRCCRHCIIPHMWHACHPLMIDRWLIDDSASGGVGGREPRASLLSSCRGEGRGCAGGTRRGEAPRAYARGTGEKNCCCWLVELFVVACFGADGKGSLMSILVLWREQILLRILVSILLLYLERDVWCWAWCWNS